LLLTRSTGGRKLESNGVGGSGKGDWEKGNDRDAILIQEGNFPRGTPLQALDLSNGEERGGFDGRRKEINGGGGIVRHPGLRRAEPP
jgi:hypothetical protein